MAFNKNKVMESARRYVEKGQVDKAIKEYLRVVREDPKDVRVWLKVGDLYAKKGAKAEATETYLKVAKFYSEQGFYLKAVAVYKQILKLEPRLIEVNLKLAELYRQLGLMSDAMRHFEMVAGHFHREGKTKEALATVRQLVDLDPENVATRIKLAELYSKEGMVEEAVSEFANACDYLRSNNRQDDFIKVAERLLWHKPDNIPLSRELASLYLRRNDPRRALQKLQICFKANSRDVETLALLAQTFQALEQKSKTVQVLKELARVLDEDGERERAKDVHRKILALVPTDADSLAYVGQPGPAPQAAAPAPAPPPVSVTPPPILSSPPPSPLPVPRESPVQRLAASASQEPDRRRHQPTGSVPLIMDPGIGKGIRYSDSPPVDELEEFTADFTEDAPAYDGASPTGPHAEEITKILTETDVYVKYGLFQKAIDHLRRIFELDRNHVVARERLKEILLNQGREGEALTELMRLAEIAAVRGEPARAQAYLRELLGINGTYQPAFELAQRLRLSLGGAPDIDAVMDSLEGLEEGGVVPIDEELDLGELEEFEDSDVATTGTDGRPLSEMHASGGRGRYEFDFDDPGDSGQPLDRSAVTMDLGADEVESMLELIEESEDLGFDQGRGRARSSAPAAAPGYGYGGSAGYDDPYGQPAYQKPMFGSAAPGGFDDEPIFDPEDAAAFDAAIGTSRPGSQSAPLPSAPAAAASRQPAEIYDHGPATAEFSAEFNEYGYDAEPVPTAEFPAPQFERGISQFGPGHFDAEPLSDIREYEGDFGAGGVGAGDSDFNAVPTQIGLSPGGRRPTSTGLDVDITADSTGSRALSSAEKGSGNLEDDLDEADFFITQGLYSEARDIIHGLLARYPDHPLLLGKLQEVDTLDQDNADASYEQITDLGFDSIDVPGDSTTVGPLSAVVPHKPTVMLERPLEDGDSDSHYDLGLAYKEMGLYDDAIKAFKKVTESPGREVQCRLMIGLCYREQANMAEAITQFKAGLHAPGIHELEQLSLYYEIGMTYEMVNDPKEAMYFYELIRKRDPSYRDVQQRIVSIDGRLNRDRMSNSRHRPVPDDDTDDILDSLLAESEPRGRGR